MQTHAKSHNGHSPWTILTELAMEGTSSLVEAQRALLTLAQQENNILMNGVKQRAAGFIPVVALTDLVQRSLDTFIELQQDFLTTASKQAVQWLDLEKVGKTDPNARLLDLAREGVENFTRAQKKFLDLVAEEADKVSGGKREHTGRTAPKTELTKLAREASTAFIEAQKRLLDVTGQQMSVNLDAAMRTMELLSPAKLLPKANFTGEGVKSFFDAEKSLIGSLIMPRKHPRAEVKATPKSSGARRRKVHREVLTAS